MIIALVNTSFTSHNYHFFLLVVRTFKISSLRNFKYLMHLLPFLSHVTPTCTVEGWVLLAHRLNMCCASALC